MNNYDAYEITPMRLVENDPVLGEIVEPADPGDKVHFWTLFGHVPGEGVECLDDFPTEEAAIIGLMYRALRHATVCLEFPGEENTNWTLVRAALEFARRKP